MRTMRIKPTIYLWKKKRHLRRQTLRLPGRSSRKHRFRLFTLWSATMLKEKRKERPRPLPRALKKHQAHSQNMLSVETNWNYKGVRYSTSDPQLRSEVWKQLTTKNTNQSSPKKKPIAVAGDIPLPRYLRPRLRYLNQVTQSRRYQCHRRTLCRWLRLRWKLFLAFQKAVLPLPRWETYKNIWLSATPDFSNLCPSCYHMWIEGQFFACHRWRSLHQPPAPIGYWRPECPGLCGSCVAIIQLVHLESRDQGGLVVMNVLVNFIDHPMSIQEALRLLGGEKDVIPVHVFLKTKFRRGTRASDCFKSLHIRVDYKNGQLFRPVAIQLWHEPHFSPVLLRQWITEAEIRTQPTIIQYSDVTPLGFHVIDTTKLCLVELSRHQWPRYMALSYVWGTETDALKLTKKNVKEFMESGFFSTDMSSQTKLSGRVRPMLRDCITLAKDLGYDYIWIDRYCIIQNGKDELIQIHNMNHIYEHAALTLICAFDSGTEDRIPGFRVERVPTYKATLLQEGQESRFSQEMIISQIKKTKWNTRGWTFQEFLFSHRRLYITNSEVFYDHHGYGHAMESLNWGCPDTSRDIAQLADRCVIVTDPDIKKSCYIVPDSTTIESYFRDVSWVHRAHIWYQMLVVLWRNSLDWTSGVRKTLECYKKLQSLCLAGPGAGYEAESMVHQLTQHILANLAPLFSKVPWPMLAQYYKGLQSMKILLCYRTDGRLENILDKTKAALKDISCSLKSLKSNCYNYLFHNYQKDLWWEPMAYLMLSTPNNLFGSTAKCSLDSQPRLSPLLDRYKCWAGMQIAIPKDSCTHTDSLIYKQEIPTFEISSAQATWEDMMETFALGIHDSGYLEVMLSLLTEVGNRIVPVRKEFETQPGENKFLEPFYLNSDCDEDKREYEFLISYLIRTRAEMMAKIKGLENFLGQPTATRDDILMEMQKIHQQLSMVLGILSAINEFQCTASKMFLDNLEDKLDSQLHQRYNIREIMDWKHAQYFLEDFSRRKLTFPRDRIHAASGIITHISKNFKSIFYYGHPLYGPILAESLLFYYDKPLDSEAQLDNVPSWSWQRFNRPITFWIDELELFAGDPQRCCDINQERRKIPGSLSGNDRLMEALKIKTVCLPYMRVQFEGYGIWTTDDKCTCIDEQHKNQCVSVGPIRDYWDFRHCSQTRKKEGVQSAEVPFYLIPIYNSGRCRVTVTYLNVICILADLVDTKDEGVKVFKRLGIAEVCVYFDRYPCEKFQFLYNFLDKNYKGPEESLYLV